MSKKIFRSKQEWQLIIDRYTESDLTQLEFCKSEGISITSFHKWQQKLKKSAPFIDVTMPPSPSWHVELELSQGVVLRIR